MSPVTPALACDPDMKAIFASDCVMCHGPTRADGNYRMTTYAQVMTAVRAGSASSRLVTITQASGSMYRYFSNGHLDITPKRGLWHMPVGTTLTLQYERYLATTGFQAAIFSGGVRIPMK